MYPQTYAERNAAGRWVAGLRRPFRIQHFAELSYHSAMLIRPATPLDAHRIAEIHVASWRAAYRGLMADATLQNLSVERRTQTWSQELAKPTRDNVVIEVDGIVQGWATFGPARDADVPTAAEVTGIYLDPACYHKGLGKALWLEISRILTARQFPLLVVWVLAGNTSARKFYEAMGGQLDADSEKSWTGEGVVLMQVRYRFALPSRGL